MKQSDYILKNKLNILIVIAAFCVLYISSQHSYLLFHGIVEVFSIVIACAIFMFAWNARRIMDNPYFVYIGIAFLFVGCLDFFHTLAYPGMNVLQRSDTNLAAQLWIGARSVESLSLLLAIVLINRRVKAGAVLSGYFVVFCLLALSIFYWRVFPTCFVDGTGLTAFKVASEYTIVVILLAAIYLLRQRRHQFDRRVFILLTASMVVTIVSELAFTLYTDAYGIANVIGHFLKVVSFYLIYKAVIESGLEKPYTVLFKNLKDSEEALRHERDFAQGLVNTAQAIVLTLDTESRIIHFNPYMEEISGYHLEEVKGKDWFTTFLPERNREKTRELFLTAISDIQTRGNIDAILTKDGQERDIVWYDKTLKDSSGNVIGLLTIGQDITERKRLEENLEKERQDFIFHFCNYIF